MTKLLGDKPNQAPTNADLGDLAYQDMDKLPTINVADDGLVVTSSGNVGIGAESPTAKVDIIETVASPTSSIWTGGTLALKDDTAYAEGVGGSLILEGKFNSSGSYSTFGYIRGSKRDATDGGFRGGIVYGTRNGDHVFVTNSAGQTDGTDERMRIDSSGNVGIGAASPNSTLAITSTGNQLGIIDSSGTSTHSMTTLNMDSDVFHIQSRNSSGTFIAQDYSISKNASGASLHRWYIGSSEKMRITSAGDVGISATSSVGSDSTSQGFWFNNSESARFSRASNISLVLNRITTTGSIQSLRYNGAQVGSISVTASATAYNTSSDYRLKENVVNLSGAIDRVKLLKPSRFNFIADPDTTVDGFVAHEVSDIVPEAVHGEKDAVDADGNPEYQGIDQSKLVPVLTAALQEALTKIEALEARIVALETA